MPTTEEVLALAKAFAKVSASEESVLRCICASVCERMGKRLRDGVDVGNCHESLLCGFAMMAAAEYTVASENDVSEFSAGELKVKRTADGGGLGHQAALILAPFCRGELRLVRV